MRRADVKCTEICGEVREVVFCSGDRASYMRLGDGGVVMGRPIEERFAELDEMALGAD
jgi:hypothetical protein